MASSVASTLQHVTERKLAKLAHQIENFRSIKASILADAGAQPTAVEKTRALLDGCAKHGIAVNGTGLSVKNIQRYLAQAEHDSSVSPALLDEWMNKVRQQIDIQELKYEFASLFGKLVTERLRDPDEPTLEIEVSSALPETGKQPEGAKGSAVTPASIELAGRQEMAEQREMWESYAFNKLERDQAAIDAYLKDLFSFAKQSKKLKQTPLKELQVRMGKFGIAEPLRFTDEVVKVSIAGVLQSDLFVGEKRAALVDLQNRPAVLKEMADVLNMDLDAIENWSWGSEPIPLTMRRQVNGRYRVYYDEELHTAIFLRFLGVKLAVHMKSAFTDFFNSGAWTQTPHHALTPDARQRRRYFLGETSRGSNVNTSRRQRYQKDFFMTQLPDEVDDSDRDYNDMDVDAVDGQTKSPLEIKESMHRLMTTEMLLQKHIYGEFTLFQSDFKWFGPGLPHDSIFATLKFLGVKGKWLTFFQHFLESPVAWSQPGNPTTSSSVRARSRGVPMLHVLSDALGEAILFCLDFAVNQKTGGSDLYRFHDDLWFWGQQSACIRAWEAIKEFSSIMGLEINLEKTGCVQVFRDPDLRRPLPKELPAGDVTWGFLRLDPSAAQWVVDQSKIEAHVAELRHQLGAGRSVLAWIQAWNSYVYRFLATNLARSANCFGSDHVDMVIKVFAHIQQSLFASDGADCDADVGQYLRNVIRDRFGTEVNIPDGFFYFPTHLGGLEMRNPFVPLFIVRDQLRKPEDRVMRAFEEDEELYENAKKRFQSGDYMPTRSLEEEKWEPVPGAIVVERRNEDSDDEPEGFMSWAEFTHFSEETSANLRSAYDELQEMPEGASLEQTAALLTAFQALQNATKDDSAPSWGSLDPYWRWVFGLYASEVVAKFGGLQIGEKAMLPLGLVAAFTSEKTRWV